MPKKVFISYRREDAAPAAGRVYDRLSHLLSKRNVFFDVSTIRGGEEFEARIISEIEASDVVLVFIGKNWLCVSGENGRPRIWEPGDYVRAEVRLALNRNMLVLPILVEGAQMPAPDLLPNDVSPITKRNAVVLRHQSFDDDTQKIVATIFGVSEAERPWENRGRALIRIAYSIAGASVAALLLILCAAVHFWVSMRPVSASIGGPATQLLLIVGVVLGAWLGLRMEAQRRRRPGRMRPTA